MDLNPCDICGGYNTAILSNDLFRGRLTMRRQHRGLICAMLLGAILIGPFVWAQAPNPGSSFKKSGTGPRNIYFNFFQHLDVSRGREASLAGKRVAELFAKHGIKADF